MVTPEVMDQLKDGFWEAVVDCLVDFHHMPRSEAAPKAGKARAILDRGPASPLYSDVIYNDEPFNIANDIARQPLNRGELNEAYLCILERRVGSESGIVVTEVPIHTLVELARNRENPCPSSNPRAA